MIVANFDTWQYSHPYIKIIRKQRVVNKENDYVYTDRTRRSKRIFKGQWFCYT